MHGLMEADGNMECRGIICYHNTRMFNHGKQSPNRHFGQEIHNMRIFTANRLRFACSLVWCSYQAQHSAFLGQLGAMQLLKIVRWAIVCSATVRLGQQLRMDPLQDLPLYDRATN